MCNSAVEMVIRTETRMDEGLIKVSLGLLGRLPKRDFLNYLVGIRLSGFIHHLRFLFLSYCLFIFLLLLFLNIANILKVQRRIVLC